jgi:hypothetical protein
MSKKITTALQNWSTEQDVKSYIKQRLGIEKEGKKNIDAILDNAIANAKVEDEPKWTPMLLKSIESDSKKAENPTNIFIAAEAMKERGREMVDVTPEKVSKSIEDII